MTKLRLPQGYIKPVDLWTLLALQHEKPEQFGKQIVSAGLLSALEVAEELEAYYLMIGNRATVLNGSSSDSRSGLTIKSTGSQATYHARPSHPSRFGSHKRS